MGLQDRSFSDGVAWVLNKTQLDSRKHSANAFILSRHQSPYPSLEWYLDTLCPTFLCDNYQIASRVETSSMGDSSAQLYAPQVAICVCSWFPESSPYHRDKAALLTRIR